MFNRFRRQQRPVDDGRSSAVPVPATASDPASNTDAALAECITAFLLGSTRPGSAQPGRVAQVTAAARSV